MNRRTILILGAGAALLVGYLVFRSNKASAAPAATDVSSSGLPAQAGDAAGSGSGDSGDLSSLLSSLNANDTELTNALLNQAAHFGGGGNVGTQGAGSSGDAGTGSSSQSTAALDAAPPDPTGVPGTDPNVHAGGVSDPSQIAASGYNPYTDPNAINSTGTGNAQLLAFGSPTPPVAQQVPGAVIPGGAKVAA